MRFSALFFTLTLLLLTTSCAKKNANESKVKIQFDKSVFTGAAATLTKISASNDHGPNWGLNDPTDLSQVNCWGVFVGGPESFMNSSSCQNENGENIASFGPRAGFYSINESGEVVVPGGKNRRFYLAAMAAANGQCERGFAQSPDINFSNYSAPFIIGYAEADLTGAEANVSIRLQNNFSSNNKINDCDFINDDGSGSPTTYLSVNYPEVKRSVFVDDEVGFKTVSFTHNGDSVRCSKDGGTNFISCDSANTLVWDVTAPTTDHYIRVLDSDNAILDEVIFKPSNLIPNLEIVTCTHFVTATSNFDNAQITAALSTDNSVLCFHDGVTVTPASNTQLALSARNNVTLIAREGDTATLHQNSTDILLNITTSTGIKIIGLDLLKSMGSSDTVTINGGNNIHFQDVLIDTTAGSEDGLYVNGAGGTTPIHILGSKIRHTGTGRALITNTGSHVNVKDSYIMSQDQATLTHASGGYTNVEESIIYNAGSTSLSFVISIFSSTNLTVNNSLILDGSGAGIKVEGQDSTSDAYLTLNNNDIVRLNSNNGTTNAAIRMDPSNLTATAEENLVSNQNGNYFCAQDHTSVAFLSMTSGTLGTGSNWSDSNQMNGATPNLTTETCPTLIQDKLTALGL